jgi:hypothetical protein
MKVSQPGLLLHTRTVTLPHTIPSHRELQLHHIDISINPPKRREHFEHKALVAASTMSTSIPILFRLGTSSRHEIILLDTSSKPSLKSLNKQITSTIAESPNCAEFMGKYKKAEGEQIQEFKIHWDRASRDGKIWPEYTVVTDENLAAIMEMLKLKPGKDVLEIKVGKAE